MAATQTKYFGTDGIRGKVGGAVINAAFALRLGHAAGLVLLAQAPRGHRPSVLIGKDTRISGYMLESSLEAGLSAAGVDVVLAGPIPTPAVAYLTRALRLSAGIVISASHNPFDDNGIKFFSAQGSKFPDQTEQAIEAALDQPMGCAPSEGLGRVKRLDDAAGRYIEFCKASFPSDMDLNGLRIVVDAAHGAAYHIAPNVFRELGATVIPVGCEPNGFNINEKVGATHPETLAEKVREHRADLGVALDGDADRLQMVDASGRMYNGDELLYVIVRDRMTQGPVAGVAGTVMTNYAFERRMADLGVPFVRTPVGDKNVMQALQDKGWLFGGESSGHILCLDRHSTGDGVLAALQVIAAIRRSGKGLPALTSELRLLPQKLVNVKLQPDLEWESHPGLAAAYREVSATLQGRGRVLIRPSGTEPKLRLMVEADEEMLAVRCVDRLATSLN
ncbi:phosphoglucosamine mutase [Pigmentiphaga sp.]|uniref:phosphoglucosamine mutase n=1 Tax=Pigmentiphaga sp. TaxID=1977564 RepID=UPI00128B8FF3|nr:phosphoglucosamine mutase [Pigmentiphaga sp.]MPS27831.1 phosphoglucosamine mutase [Alcaligenaceae bacterium SAGV5]MPS50990.1 phosphoglucosamine mutase [Alcaligenaceae bacterium SAGV3]MPT55807.1 phosphoglucosamine mutase [Alcaligenaceae bacterium]